MINRRSIANSKYLIGLRESVLLNRYKDNVIIVDFGDITT